MPWNFNQHNYTVVLNEVFPVQVYGNTEMDLVFTPSDSGKTKKLTV